MTTAPDTTAVPDGAELTGFGMELQLELAGCDPKVIGSGEELALWAQLLAEKIGMTLYKEPVVDHFGEGTLRGWTCYQRITTSNLLVHAVDGDNSAFVNVFSCRAFDPDAAIAFTVEAFGARAHTSHVRMRVAPEIPDGS